MPSVTTAIASAAALIPPGFRFWNMLVPVALFPAGVEEFHSSPSGKIQTGAGSW